VTSEPTNLLWKRRGLIRGHHRNGKEIFSSIIIQFSSCLFLCKFCILKKGIKSDCNDLGSRPSHAETSSWPDSWSFAEIFCNCFQIPPSPYKKREATLNKGYRILHPRGLNFVVPLWFNFFVREVLGLAKCNGLVIWAPYWMLMKLFCRFLSKKCAVCFPFVYHFMYVFTPLK